MAGYERQIDTAKRLIKKKGKLVSWVKHTVATSNTQPWKTSDGGAPTTFPVYMVFLTPKGSLNELIHLMAGSSVPMGAPDAIMAQVPFEPQIDDTIMNGSDALVVQAIDIVAPNGDVILYKIKFS